MLSLIIFAALNIAVSIAPIKGVLKDISKNNFNYSLIYPSNVNPHLYDPKPKDIMKVKRADLFIYAGRAEPGGKKLCRMAKACIKLEGLIKGADSMNPHVWLSPYFVKTVADTLSAILSTMQPALKDSLVKNAMVLKNNIDSLLNLYRIHDSEEVLLMHGAFVPLFKELGYQVGVIVREPGMEARAGVLKNFMNDVIKGKFVLGVCETNRPCREVHMLAKRGNFNVVELNPLYENNFSLFLAKSLEKIKNATHSHN